MFRPLRRLQLTLLLVLAAGHGVLWAEPMAWSINSRGNLTDDQQVHALWRLDLSTGQSEYVGWTSYLDVEGLALNEDGTLYGADDESKTLITVGTSSGLGLPIGNRRANFGLPISEVLDLGMTFTCDGQLLVSSDQRESLFLADPTDGMLTRIGEEGSLGAPITDIAAWGDSVYGIGQGIDGNGQSDSPFLYVIDVETATAEVVGPLGDAVAPYANAGLAFDANGQLWALTDRRDNGNPNLASEILQIDPATGTATKIADADVVGFESLAIAPPGGCDRGPLTPVIVPALSPAGLGILALLLLTVGWTLLTPRR